MLRRLQFKQLPHQDKLHQAQLRLQGQIRKRKQHQDKQVQFPMQLKQESKLQQRQNKLRKAQLRL